MSGTPPNPILDPYQYLMIIPNPDGSVTRTANFPNAAADPNHPPLSRDIPINPSSNTWARIFLPTQTSPTQKLPLVLYFHGGGFILLSAATTFCHDFCSNMAVDLAAVVVSVEYRLAPEHRLPAAYDDCLEALHWIKSSEDVWLRDYVDYEKCFLMGTSAGGNIAYQVGLRAAEAGVDSLAPLKIQGLILHHPFFGGVRRSESEVRQVNDPVLPPVVSDVMWELSLPNGVDRDHEYCNPTIGGGSKMLDQIGWLGWKVLMSGGDRDPLIERMRELVKLMEEKGIKVESHFAEGDFHGIEIVDPSKAKSLYVVLKNFILSSA